VKSHRVEASRFVDVAPEHAFDRLIATPLPSIFVKRFAAFPPVSEVRDQPDEPWGAVGQSRTIVTGDGGTFHETLTSVERPTSFGYVIDDITGPMRPFVRTVEGEWSVVPEGGGSRVGWSWILHPLAPPARLTMNVIGKMWHGYADRALERVEAILTFPHAD
jgi:Polyketide cyclase / dehydrase and lipid transport